MFNQQEQVQQEEQQGNVNPDNLSYYRDEELPRLEKILAEQEKLAEALDKLENSEEFKLVFTEMFFKDYRNEWSKAFCNPHNKNKQISAQYLQASCTLEEWLGSHTPKLLNFRSGVADLREEIEQVESYLRSKNM